MNGTTAWPYPFWIAHRGAGLLAPENTLAAFRLGASYGYRAFECDAKLSADGLPFLLHDDTLQRTTSGEGPARDCDWTHLSRLDAGGWHSRAYAGEPPASLEAVARYVQRNGFALNIEIKPSPGQEEETGRVVAEWVERLWPAHARAPLLSSFRTAALEGARAAAAKLPRALLLDTLWSGWPQAARELGCVAVVTNHEVTDAELIGQLHADGLRSLVYTVNDPSAARRLMAAKVDGIVTDAVDRFSPAGPAAGVLD